MNIQIRETKETKTLRLRDPRTGVDWIEDFIGNAGGWEFFEYDEDSGNYLVDQDDFDWWNDIIDEYQKADNEEYAFIQSLTEESYCEYLAHKESYMHCDFEDQPYMVTVAIRDFKKLKA